MPLLLIALAVALSLMMMGGWLFQKRTGNGGWTDVVWSCVVGLVGAAGALWPLEGAPSARQWLAAALVAAWSARLGTHLALRVGRHDGENVRYAHLRKTWGPKFDAEMFRFLQVQAGAAFPLVMAVTVAAHRPRPIVLDIGDYAAALIFLGALFGEHTADAQLKAFKAANQGREAICDVGLWAWSRHPNYFFEWLAWLAWPFMAIGPAGSWGWGWLAITAPASMYLLLRYGSGVPPLETRMARSRGQAWKAYAANTSIFFPFPPKTRPA